MESRREEKERRRQERLAREYAEQAKLTQPGNNRVLVGVPARLEAAKKALREHEKTLEQLRQLYGQRLVLKDSIVLDQIGDLLGCPPLKGDNTPKRAARAASEPRSDVRDYVGGGVYPGEDCPACTGGVGDFCKAHDWHGKT